VGNKEQAGAKRRKKKKKKYRRYQLGALVESGKRGVKTMDVATIKKKDIFRGENNGLEQSAKKVGGSQRTPILK